MSSIDIFSVYSSVNINIYFSQFGRRTIDLSIDTHNFVHSKVHSLCFNEILHKCKERFCNINAQRADREYHTSTMCEKISLTEVMLLLFYTLKNFYEQGTSRSGSK